MLTPEASLGLNDVSESSRGDPSGSPLRLVQEQLARQAIGP